MTEIILVAQLLVAAGAALMAMKYLAGPVPADYHRQIIEKSGGGIETGHQQVLTALYRAMGGGFLGNAVSLALLAWFAGSSAWGQWAILLTGLASLVPIMMIAYRTERETGVKTPWRIAAILQVVLIAAFLLFLAS